MKHLFGLLALVALVGCTVNNKDMEKKIKEQLSEHLKVSAVDCPTGQSMKEGTTFDCKVKFEDDKTFPIHVSILADKQFSANWDEETTAELVTELKE
jgi:hypothetical protein